MKGFEVLGNTVEMAALEIRPQSEREESQIVQRDGDGDANGVAATRISSSDAAILMARRMICHGAASRCITSDSANGSSCGVCKGAALREALTTPIC
jgi:hypothetical protein